MYSPTYVRSLAARLEVSGHVVATRCCFGKFTSARHVLRHKWAAVLSVSEYTEKNEKNEKKNDDDDCLFHINIATNVTIMSLDCLDTCASPIPPRPLRYPHAAKSLQIACHA